MINKFFFTLIWMLTLLIGVFLIIKVWRFLPVYTSAVIREDLQQVLARYRYDAGVGLSNLDFEKIVCRDQQCSLFVTYRYHGRPETFKTNPLIIKWPVGQSDRYVILQS